MKRNQPKVEQVEMNEIATKASRVAESRTACLIDESLRIARNNNQDPFRTLAVSAYLQGVQDALTPPAEPSGNTGEFKCATCRDTKQVPFVYGQEYDCVMSTTVPCPDCSAAQPARHSEALSSFTAYCKEHPSERFWQALRNWSRWGYILGAQTRDGGTIDTFNLEGLDGTHAAHEQAEREGK